MAEFDFFMLKGHGGDAYLLKHYDSPKDKENNNCVSVLIDGGGNDENKQWVLLLDSLHDAGLRVKDNIPILDYVFLTHFHIDHYTGLMALFDGAPYKVDEVGNVPVHVDTLFLLKEMYVDAARFASLRLDDFNRADLPLLVNRLMAPAPARNIEDVIWGGAAAVPIQDGDIWGEFLRYHRLASQKINWLVLELHIKAEEYVRGSLRTGGNDVIGRLRMRQQGIYERIVAMEKECNILETTSSDAVLPESTPVLTDLYDDFDYAGFAKCFARDLRKMHKQCEKFSAAVDKAKKDGRLGKIEILDYWENGVPGMDKKHMITPKTVQAILKKLSFRCFNGEKIEQIRRAPLYRHSLFPFGLSFFHGNPLGVPDTPCNNYWSRVFYFDNSTVGDDSEVLDEILLLADSELNFWKKHVLSFSCPFPVICLPHHTSGQPMHAIAYSESSYMFMHESGGILFFRSDGPGSSGWKMRPGKEFIELRKSSNFINYDGTLKSTIYLSKRIYCMTCDNCGIIKDRKENSNTELGRSNRQSVHLRGKFGTACPMNGRSFSVNS